MQPKIRALGVAPYGAMKYLMEDIAKNYAALELHVFVGTMKKGEEIARQNLNRNYDVIISRGGTAELIRKITTIPVIEIGPSVYDILRAFKLAENYATNFAVIGFPGITKVVQILCDLLKYKVTIVTIHDEDSTELELTKLKEAGFKLIVGDTNATMPSKSLDMKSILITSGQESIEQAFDQAIKLCTNYVRLKEDTLVLREIIKESDTDIVIFDEKQNLYYSSYKLNDNLIIEMLYQELPEVVNGNNQRIVRTIGNTAYDIKAVNLDQFHQRYTVFFIKTTTQAPNINQYAISFVNKKEAELHYRNSVFGMKDNVEKLKHHLIQMSKSSFPVLITGEEGTGKERAAQFVYINGKNQRNPLVTIDCNIINDADWQKLMQDTNSPLADHNLTIYFKNVDRLKPEFQKQLLAIFKNLNVREANLYLFSSTILPDGKTPAMVYTIMRQLSCLLVTLPSLHHMKAEIPALANTYLKKLNHELGKQIIGFDDEALHQMKNYAWPYNYTQLKRVLNFLAVSTDTPYIAATTAKKVLGREEALYIQQQAAKETVNNALALNLRRPLKDINGEIIKEVVAANHGNQSLAAKQLHISRTTLWRYLNDK